MKKGLIFFLLLNSYVISCTKLNAQSYRTKIAGVVLDSLTRENIKGATVSIKNEKDSFQTATNDKGNFAFEIEKAEKYLITVSCIGFFQFQKSFSINNDVHDLVIVLKDSIIELAEFKIKAKKVLFEPGKITFLTDALDLKTASSAFDLLKKTPFLTVSNDNVKIKGRIDAEVYLDGSPLTNIKSLENLSAKKILKIEILSNPSSSNDIEGKKGMVYITTKKVQEGYFGSLTGQLATSKKRDDSFSGFFSTKGVKMEFNLNVGWNYYRRPFESNSRWLRRINEESFSQSEFAMNRGFNNFFVPGINYSIDSLTIISFKGTFGLSDYNNKITTNYYFPNSVSDDSLGVIRTGNEKWVRRSATNNVSFKRRKAGSKDNFSVYLRTNSYNTKKEYNNNKIFPLITPEYQQNNELKFDEIAGQFDYQLFDLWKSSINVGAKYTNRHNVSDFFLENYNTQIGKYEKDTTASQNNNFISRQQIGALYFTISKRINKIVSFNIGNRIEYTWEKIIFGSNLLLHRNYITNLPSFSLLSEVSKTQSIEFSFSKRIIRPGISYLNPFMNNGRSPREIIQGNPLLKPEIINRYDLTYSFSKQNSFFSLGVYLTSYNSLIAPATFILSGDTLIKIYQNINRSFDYGVSFNGSNSIWGKMKLTYTVGIERNAIKNKNGMISGISYYFSNSLSYSLPKNILISGFYQFNSPIITFQGKKPQKSSIELSLEKKFFKKLSITFSASDFLPGNSIWKYSITNEDIYKFNRNDLHLNTYKMQFNYEFGKEKNRTRTATKINSSDLKD